ncbi:MAG: hypothetical protein H7A21_11565 [Spirochaetales bacterium]|nr:hypothetical protein [Leptospiraceae bacterium]MCP5482064.1 hypothetical protein [Spirochaetales bacterium]MCP5484980.1 hypothetical protein [Spirochaetales bacterium]
MRTSLIACLPVLLSAGSLFAQVDDFIFDPADPLSIETADDSRTPGRHEWKAIYSARQIEIRALLFVPQNVSPTSPIVVLYHGMSQAENAYREAAEFFVARAEERGFVLLSVQNYWPIGQTRHQWTTAELLYHSSRAGAVMVQEIRRLQISQGPAYTFGHSAGGFAAICAALLFPDIYSGFGANKANYYQDEVDLTLRAFVERSFRENLQRAPHDLVGTTVLGGPQDAARVRHQMPQARIFLKENLDIPLENGDFPDEPHNISDADFEFFWSMVSR